MLKLNGKTKQRHFLNCVVKMRNIRSSTVSVTIILLTLISNSLQRCCLSSNPGFKRQPVVRNVSPTLVSVSWIDSIAERECVDIFETFYWRTKSETRSGTKKTSKAEEEYAVSS